MADQMLAAVLRGPKDLAITEVSRPLCPSGGLLIQVRACSLCATDIKMWQRGHRDLLLPRILGHELAGEIAVVSDDLSDFQVGDRVQVAPGLPCGRCRWCLQGAPNMCQAMQIIGFHHDGGLAEFVAVPAAGVHQGAVSHLPDALAFDLAALAEPLACCLNAQELARVGMGDQVAIWGAGPQGWLQVQVARLRGASRIILVENDPGRLQDAVQAGADLLLDIFQEDPVTAILEATAGKGVEVVIPACGSLEAFDWGVAVLAKRGRLCLYSGLPKEVETHPVNLNRLHYLEASLVGAYGCTSRQNALALELMAKGRIRVDRLITHRLPLNRVEEGFELVQSRRGLKVVIECT
ncbi:MAG TPA: alcohol dehydrogenase [Desulfobacterales bacterium]|nr:alcohol dehydrogenase [Desulfobacterales bacterium]